MQSGSGRIGCMLRKGPFMAEQAKAQYDVLFLCTDNVTAMRYRRNRIAAFASLPATTLDRSSLSVRMNEIGHGEGAITPRNSAA